MAIPGTDLYRQPFVWLGLALAAGTAVGLFAARGALSRSRHIDTLSPAPPPLDFGSGAVGRAVRAF